MHREFLRGCGEGERGDLGDRELCRGDLGEIGEQESLGEDREE